jgi:hypothetical protein
MAHGIVRLADNEYVDWSTVCDAPVTYIVDRAEAVGTWGEERVARADANNHSWLDMPAMAPNRVIAGNRAGKNETELTLAELRREYRS